MNKVLGISVKNFTCRDVEHWKQLYSVLNRVTGYWNKLTNSLVNSKNSFKTGLDRLPIFAPKAYQAHKVQRAAAISLL